MKLVSKLLVLVWSVHLSYNCCNGQTANVTRIYLDRTLNALQRALEFFGREHRTVNVDGLMCTRAIQGQLRVLYRKIVGAPNLWNVDPDILRRIRDLSVYAGQVTERGVPYRIFFNPRYFQIYSAPIRRGFWELEYRSRNFPNSNLIYPYREDQAVTADTSNYCMGEILGTLSQLRPACNISSSCWRSMTRTGYYGYSLSHNVLYLMWGEMSGCDRQMERRRQIHSQPTIDEQNREFCANMMAESRHIANNSYIWAGVDGRDLFMEDAFFCGILGFRQFFRYDWLDDILSWQHPVHGCYSMDRNFPRSNTGRLVRKKRSESVMRFGCLSHLTGMALGSLTLYVRYLLEHLTFLTNGTVI